MNSDSSNRLERNTGHADEMNQYEIDTSVEIECNQLKKSTEIWLKSGRSGADMWSLKFKVIKFISKTWSYLNFYETSALENSFDCLKPFHFFSFFIFTFPILIRCACFINDGVHGGTTHTVKSFRMRWKGK